MISLLIEHAFTDELPDGRLSPPCDDGRWYVICASPGTKTVWRKISLVDATGGARDLDER
jgi:hypothetical protein